MNILDFVNEKNSKQIFSISEEKARPERCLSSVLTPCFEKESGYLYLKMIGNASGNLFNVFRVDKV